jgi:hypothetical protein
MDDQPLPAEEKVYILRRVAAYYGLCETVRKSSTGNLVFGGIMLAIWYFLLPPAFKYNWFGIVYLALAVLEFGTGVLNRFAPSAEGVLLDGIVLIAFGGWNLIREGLIWQQIIPGGRVSPVFVVFGGYWVYQGFQHVKNYAYLRRLFGERPSREHIRWYNGLLKEVMFADPADDPDSLALPTNPPVTAKLLGDVAFFKIVGGEVIITTRDQVEITKLVSKARDTEDDTRTYAQLTIEGTVFDPFVLSEKNRENYVQWKAEGGR